MSINILIDFVNGTDRSGFIGRLGRACQIGSVENRGTTMGYSRADKAQSHERIVKTAAARFREKGIDGISLADLMKEAGLTHGGFYRHFESRDALVAEAVDCALRASDGTLCTTVGDAGAVDLAGYI